MSCYEPNNRPRCAVCNRELEPAESRSDGEATVCGFMPCPKHPRADIVYPLAMTEGSQ